jgi:glutamine synthetase
VESAKGECNYGQHEIVFRYADALTHVRQPRHLQDGGQGDRGTGGMSLTFMAKYDEREGNSCHIHLSSAATMAAPW